MPNSFKIETFKSIDGLTYAVAGLFLFIAVSSLLLAVFSAVYAIYPEWMISSDDGDIEIGLLLLGLVTLLEIPLRLALVVTLLAWMYRAYANLSALDATGLNHSPGWAIGWWFIPFANLVMPYQIMKEIFVESTSEFDPKNDFFTPTDWNPLEVLFWWLAFIISQVLYRISDTLIGSEAISPNFAVVHISAALLALVSALLGAYITWRIKNGQKHRHAILGKANHIEPPPPPSFYPETAPSGTEGSTQRA